MPRNHEIFAERNKQKEQEKQPKKTKKEPEIVVIENAEEVPSYRQLDENEGE